MNITAQEFFKAGELPDDCALSQDELRTVFWKFRELQQAFERQQIFWKSTNGAIAEAYKKLATVQGALQSSREQLREVNERLEEKVGQRTAALDEAREFAESIVASMSDALVMIDQGGVITRVNRSALRLLGYDEAELVGQPLSALLALNEGDEHALPADWHQALLRDEVIKNLEASYLTKQAAAVPVLFSAAKVKSARDELLGIVCVAKDVTERRQAEKELRAQLQRIRQQQETISVLFTPIIQLWRRVLALPIVGEIDYSRAAEMMERLLAAVVETRCEFVIVDVTGLKNVDALTTEHLLKLNRAARLLGARCLVSGISPAIARTLVELGSDSASLTSFRTLEAALRHALLRLGELPGEPET